MGSSHRAGLLPSPRPDQPFKLAGLCVTEFLLSLVEVDHYQASFQPAESRIAALLLELAGSGSAVEGLTQRELGKKVGLARETVAVTIAALKMKKLVAVGRHKTTRLDRKALLNN